MLMRSQVILALCIAVALFSVGLTFFRTYIKKDFVVVELAETEDASVGAPDATELPN